MMHHLYRDYLEGTFVPDVTITKRDDNGHFTATSMGLEVTHYDQAEAINQLTTKIHEGLQKGEIHPFMG